MEILEIAMILILFVVSTKKLIHFLSKKLISRELNYTKLEKSALALVYKARKFQHYFLGKSIKVFIEQPLKKVLDYGHESNKLAEWSNFLSTYYIAYELRKAEKGLAIASLLVDFLIEGTPYEEQVSIQG